MSGTKAGAQKARQTNVERYGSDFYAKVGSNSWKDPKRSREVGFALDKQLAIEAGRKGGKNKKGKKHAKKEDFVTAEEIAALAEDDKDGPRIGE